MLRKLWLKLRIRALSARIDRATGARAQALRDSDCDNAYEITLDLQLLRLDRDRLEKEMFELNRRT
jgi:hypothetical protein